MWLIAGLECELDIGVRLTQPLNDRQLAVLEWIAEGCSPTDAAIPSYKRTAQTLRDRRLVAISKRGGGWSAQLPKLASTTLITARIPPPSRL
jgi:hypothetical protein